MALRVALVGAGGIGNYHVSQLNKLRDHEIRIVGVADVAEDRAAQMAQRLGCDSYTDHVAMYEKEHPDAVFIGIPPFAHTDQEIAAAQRGIAIFVQKPPAANLAKAIEIQTAIEKAGVIAAVGHQDRYLDVVAEARSALDGVDVPLAMGYWMGSVARVPWWRVRAQSGGQAVEQTIHIFDLARYLFGEVETVQASANAGWITDLPGYDVDDSSVMTMRFRTGMICSIFSACFIDGAPGKAGLDAFGRSVRVEYVLRRSVRIMTNAGMREMNHRNDEDMECVRTFVNAVTSGDPSAIRSPYADAVRSLALPLAGQRSIEHGGCAVRAEV